MHRQRSHDRIVPVTNLLDYFRASIDTVISDQGVDVNADATHYVVNLLTLFSRSEELYEDDGEADTGRQDPSVERVARSEQRSVDDGAAQEPAQESRRRAVVGRVD